MALLEVLQGNTQTDACIPAEPGQSNNLADNARGIRHKAIDGKQAHRRERRIIRDLPELAPVTMTACFPDMLNPSDSTFQDLN